MAVFRVEKTKDFTIMCNHHLRNTELSFICKDGVDSISMALKELEWHGYLTRQRIRYENGQLGDIEYTIHEQSVTDPPKPSPPKRENPVQEKPVQAKTVLEKPEQENPCQLNTNSPSTNESKTDLSRTHPSIYPYYEADSSSGSDRMDRIDMERAYREIIQENIEYDCLVIRYEQTRVDEAVGLILENVLSKRSCIRIAGDDFPQEVVKSRFLKLTSEHLKYVFDCIDKNTTKVGNIKAYLLAAFYNAPGNNRQLLPSRGQS